MEYFLIGVLSNLEFAEFSDFQFKIFKIRGLLNFGTLDIFSVLK